MAYSYIAKNYVDKFRVKTVIDMRTNDFCRDPNGNIENGLDVYIACFNGIKVFHYGGRILEVYIPSTGRGHNIIKKIYAKYINPQNVDIDIHQNLREETIVERESITIKDENLYKEELQNKNNVIYDIFEDDIELWFKIRDKDFDKIVPYIKPMTAGAGISPWSSRNLPKSKKYEYTANQIQEYEKIIKGLSRNDKLKVGRINNRFLSEIMAKKLGVETTFLKKDIREKMMKPKDYIYYKGFEKEYLEYLQKELVNEE